MCLLLPTGLRKVWRTERVNHIYNYIELRFIMLKIYRQEFLAWQSLLEIYLLIDADIIIEYLFDCSPNYWL